MKYICKELRVSKHNTHHQKNVTIIIIFCTHTKKINEYISLFFSFNDFVLQTCQHSRALCNLPHVQKLLRACFLFSEHAPRVARLVAHLLETLPLMMMMMRVPTVRLRRSTMRTKVMMMMLCSKPR